MIDPATLSIAKDIATIVGVLIALGTLFIGLATLVKSLAEYKKQGSQKRAEQFLLLRDRYSKFHDLFSLLEDDSEKLKFESYSRKVSFLGFYEEIALLLNSGLIRQEVVHYMFGYYAVRCWESVNFWKDLNRSSPYWAAFADLSERMKSIEETFEFKRDAFRV